MTQKNGLGIEEDLYQVVKSSSTPIISCCAWIGIMTSADGKVVHWHDPVANIPSPGIKLILTI